MLSKQVDALFAPWSARKGMPGAAVRVVKNGEVVHAQEYGLADIAGNVPIVPETAFLLASLTKQFTAMLVMILIKDCKQSPLKCKIPLKYESSLSEFFPQFPGYAKKITIEHLLRHTSGLIEFDELFEKAGKIDGDWPRSLRSPVSESEPTSADTLDILSQQKDLLFEPGRECRYSNSGYVVLGQIIEKVTGVPFPQFMKETIFDKVKMRDSVVPVKKWRHVPLRATSYGYWKDWKYPDIDYTPLNLVYGEDGIYTTADDMVHWGKALYPGGLLTQQELDRAFTPGEPATSNGTRYGYGWAVRPDYVEHGGEWAGFRTYIRRYPKHGLTVIVLANCLEVDAYGLGDQIAAIYL